MALFLKQQLIEQLQQGHCEVFFKKKDGTIRHMICTLNPKEVPSFFIDVLESPQNQNLNSTILPVWDVEKEGWRSFHTTSILSFKLNEDITDMDNL